MMTGNYRKGTPSDGLDIATGTLPIDLFLEQEAVKANTRLKPHFTKDWDGLSGGKKIGHIKKAEIEDNKFGLPTVEYDNIAKCTVLQKKFNINTSSFRNGDDIKEGLRCYTDGSKTSTGSGAGLCLMQDDKIIKESHIGLSRNSSVFQA